MRAGLVTFHEADNFGAVLQAYALQQTLTGLGADSLFVSFSNKAKKQETYLPAKGPTALFAQRIVSEGKKREELFRQFREQYMKCSVDYDLKDKASINKDFDCFIAGSDQIWNFRIPEVDERFFLTFAEDKKKYSYAASFGTEEFPEKGKTWCTEQLNSFQKISVRESSGQKIVKELTGRDAEVSLDPTLLLSKEDWLKIASDQGDKPYYLLFMVKYDAELHKRAKEKAESDGMELRIITAAFMPQCGFPSWSQVSVSDWVGLMAHSSGTFTNSFHGTAFSLMFERPVAVAGNAGELAKRNGRMEDILGKAGLPEAMDGGLAVPEAGKIEDNLKEDRERSIRYLKDVLADAADS